LGGRQRGDDFDGATYWFLSNRLDRHRLGDILTASRLKLLGFRAAGNERGRQNYRYRKRVTSREHALIHKEAVASPRGASGKTDRCRWS
jgi:hypothetical protein